MDQSTCDVIDWLNYFGKNYIVCANETRYVIEHIDSMGNFVVRINGELLRSEDVCSVWFRRGAMLNASVEISACQDSSVSNALCHHFNTSSQLLDDFFHGTIFSRKSINNQRFQSVNKLESLRIANNYGMKIPETIITTKKSILYDFLKKNKFKVVTKDITDGIGIETSKWCITAYTEMITEEFYNSLPDVFSPSLFQEYIKKKFEIRTFFLNDNYYSMAIFSQSNPQTVVDFRHYDFKNPNRMTPLKLPVEIENKLKKIMMELNLTSGSIDMIYSEHKEFFFLEVNPIGQFGMVSYPCNYHLEKLIATFL